MINYVENNYSAAHAVTGGQLNPV